MEIKDFEGFGRTLIVEFKCRRCKKTATRKLEDCIPSDGYFRGLYDLSSPKDWQDGGFYYPLFCPDCKKAYEDFIDGKDK